MDKQELTRGKDGGEKIKEPSKEDNKSKKRGREKRLTQIHLQFGVPNKVVGMKRRKSK